MGLPPAPFNQRTLAERWGCDPKVVVRLCRTGKIRHFKAGRITNCIPIDAVAEYEGATNGTCARPAPAGADVGERLLGPPIGQKRSNGSPGATPEQSGPSAPSIGYTPHTALIKARREREASTLGYTPHTELIRRMREQEALPRYGPSTPESRAQSDQSAPDIDRPARRDRPPRGYTREEWEGMKRCAATLDPDYRRPKSDRALGDAPPVDR